MNAYSKYNQIQMYLLDREKPSFVTNKGLYCYNVMPFGLKNTKATYQKLVNKMFYSQVGRNMKFYIDDNFLLYKYIFYNTQYIPNQLITSP